VVAGVPARQPLAPLCELGPVVALVFVFGAAVVFAVAALSVFVAAVGFEFEVVLETAVVFQVAVAALDSASVSLLGRDVLVVKGCSAQAKQTQFARSRSRPTAKSKNTFASVTRLLAGLAAAPKAWEQLRAQPA